MTQFMHHGGANKPIGGTEFGAFPGKPYEHMNPDQARALLNAIAQSKVVTEVKVAPVIGGETDAVASSLQGLAEDGTLLETDEGYVNPDRMNREREFDELMTSVSRLRFQQMVAPPEDVI